jgi:SNF2 family DNA or RNA helicase
MTTSQRTATIERFNNEGDVRVLMISTVGGIGLNLTVANVVICFVS